MLAKRAQQDPGRKEGTNVQASRTNQPSNVAALQMKGDAHCGNILRLHTQNPLWLEMLH